MMLVDFFLVLTPWRLTSSGRLASASFNAVLHQDLGHVQIGADLEGDRERVGAVAGAGGGHVDHVLHAVDLLLDGGGDGFGDHLGAGAGVGGRDLHRGRRDLGVLGHGKPPTAHRSRDHDDDRDDTGKDGAFDEDLGKHNFTPSGD